MVAAVDVAILRPADAVVPGYLVALASTERWLSHLGQMARGTTMLRVARSQLGRVKVPVPSLPDQQQVARLFFDLRHRADAATLELILLRRDLSEYRDSLIVEAVSGRLDPGMLSEDQMAESLDAVRQGEQPEVLA